MRAHWLLPFTDAPHSLASSRRQWSRRRRSEDEAVTQDGRFCLAWLIFPCAPLSRRCPATDRTQSSRSHFSRAPSSLLRGRNAAHADTRDIRHAKPPRHVAWAELARTHRLPHLRTVRKELHRGFSSGDRSMAEWLRRVVSAAQCTQDETVPFLRSTSRLAVCRRALLRERHALGRR